MRPPPLPPVFQRPVDQATKAASNANAAAGSLVTKAEIIRVPPPSRVVTQISGCAKINRKCLDTVVVVPTVRGAVVGAKVSLYVWNFVASGLPSASRHSTPYNPEAGVGQRTLGGGGGSDDGDDPGDSTSDGTQSGTTTETANSPDSTATDLPTLIASNPVPQSDLSSSSVTIPDSLYNGPEFKNFDSTVRPWPVTDPNKPYYYPGDDADSIDEMLRREEPNLTPRPAISVAP